MDTFEVAATLTSFPVVLSALLSPIDAVTLRTRPEEGEWCPLEVIGHLIACDGQAFRGRIQGILDGVPEIPSFDAWEAINARDFRASSLDELTAELEQERAHSAALVRSLSPADLATTAPFGDGRLFAAGDFVYEWCFHDQDHLQQILACTKLSYLPAMTPVMYGALTT